MSIFDGAITLPAGFDAHVHLRDGDMAAAVSTADRATYYKEPFSDTPSLQVTPTIRAGGNSAVFVMPNLVPPLTTVSAVTAYRARLQALAPDVTFLMSLYLHPSITAATIAEAKRAGVYGVKSYPAGVTTNSAAGVVDYDAFSPVFAAMQEHDLVLNLHGELPGSHGEDITVLNAEEAFLPTLHKLHARYPRLRIVLEVSDCPVRVRACEVTALRAHSASSQKNSTAPPRPQSPPYVPAVPPLQPPSPRTTCSSSSTTGPATRTLSASPSPSYPLTASP